MTKCEIKMTDQTTLILGKLGSCASHKPDLSEIAHMSSLYMWVRPHGEVSPQFVRLVRDNGGYAPGWRFVWRGTDPGRPPSENTLDDRGVVGLITPADRFYFYYPVRPSWGTQIITHDLDQVEVGAWYSYRYPLCFLSPYGVRRMLRMENHVSPEASRWSLQTKLQRYDGRPTDDIIPSLDYGPFSPWMTESEIRATVRRHGWLTIIPGPRSSSAYSIAQFARIRNL